MRRVVSTCDYLNCSEAAVERVYMKSLRRYDKRGERLPGVQRSLGSVDLCRKHLKALLGKRS